MNYRSLGNGINGAVECIDTLTNILALTLGTSVTQTTVPTGSKARPTDVAGCTLEMSASGWVGSLGVLTSAQFAALLASSIDISSCTYINSDTGAKLSATIKSNWVWRYLAQKKPLRSIPIMLLPPTLTTGGSQTLSNIADSVNSYSGTTTGFSTISRFGLVKLDNGLGDGSYGVTSQLMTGGIPRGGTGRAEMFYTGLNIEFMFDTSNAGLGSCSHIKYLIDEGDGWRLMQQSAIFLATDTGMVYHKLTFATNIRRRIAILGAAALKSVATDANSTLEASHRDGPRTIIVSDSFGGPTANITDNGGYFTYIDIISICLGLNDVIPSSIPGSSWTSSGYKDITGRVASDVTAANADLIIFALGRNDNLSSYAAVYSSVCNGLLAAKSQNKNTPILTFGMMWNMGPEYWSSTVIQAMTAIKDGSSFCKVPSISTMEITGQKTGTIAYMYQDSPAGSTFLVISNASGAGKVSVGDVLFIENEYVVVASVEYGRNVTVTKAAVYAHAANTPVVVMPKSLVWGNGYNGSGTGNAALMFGSDNVHPTDLGNLIYGLFYCDKLVELANKEILSGL